MAGLSAALVLGRARRQVLVLDGGLPRNAPAHASHGFLTRDGASPLELLHIGREQLAPYPVQVVQSQASSAQAVPDGFEVRTEDGETYSTRRLLLTTGVTDLLPELPGLREGWGVSVHHCPYCHGWELRDQTVAAYVPAGGPGAHHIGVLLRQWTPHLTILTAGPDNLTAEQARQLQALGVSLDTRPVARWEGTQMLMQDGSALPFKGVFIQPGQAHRSDLADQLGCEREENNLFLRVGSTLANAGLTSVPGVYAAGDLLGEQQVSLAVASGAKAATAINSDLCFTDAAQAVRRPQTKADLAARSPGAA